MWHERKLQGALHAEGSRPDQMRREGGERGDGMAGGEGRGEKEGCMQRTGAGGQVSIKPAPFCRSQIVFANWSSGSGSVKSQDHLEAWV